MITHRASKSTVPLSTINGLSRMTMTREGKADAKIFESAHHF